MKSRQVLYRNAIAGRDVRAYDRVTVSATLVLRTAILALKHDDDERLDPLPPGTQLQLLGEPRGSGLVDVTDSTGARYTVIAADLFERSDAYDPSYRGGTVQQADRDPA
jgi:hypothetical protein